MTTFMLLILFIAAMVGAHIAYALAWRDVFTEYNGTYQQHAWTGQRRWHSKTSTLPLEDRWLNGGTFYGPGEQLLKVTRFVERYKARPHFKHPFLQEMHASIFEKVEVRPVISMIHSWIEDTDTEYRRGVAQLKWHRALHCYAAHAVINGQPTILVYVAFGLIYKLDRPVA